RIWTHAGKKSDGGQLSRDEYISLMFDKKIDSKTNQLKTLHEIRSERNRLEPHKRKCFRASRKWA
ncbi:hypothetical protein RRG08_051746, partial [Elysia crispata]